MQSIEDQPYRYPPATLWGWSSMLCIEDWWPLAGGGFIPPSL